MPCSFQEASKRFDRLHVLSLTKIRDRCAARRSAPYNSNSPVELANHIALQLFYAKIFFLPCRFRGASQRPNRGTLLLVVKIAVLPKKNTYNGLRQNFSPDKRRKLLHLIRGHEGSAYAENLNEIWKGNVEGRPNSRRQRKLFSMRVKRQGNNLGVDERSVKKNCAMAVCGCWKGGQLGRSMAKTLLCVAPAVNRLSP
ncbi:uncharacterized protein TEOVI_000206600 [Trypanosoma equiperdum]|uniref:T. brucei spp.-specific protein n=2 Tax=Trypanozoon TaxID=39700 RepID=Q586D3_TRYB2|nr:hypothetical protein Tb927.2.5710 [Trypanosoma brucei brucei TREU927]AAQ16028.1 hypothetical protein Tb927.2.5710 [Trypanosoma brucei brucei TREU927]AAX78997.1 hypothetical protein Tb927.2.5710 [Trypanosoma brucei]SCU70492.1 hypothetical protein, conserved [Trypanosoma equiperdum]